MKENLRTHKRPKKKVRKQSKPTYPVFVDGVYLGIAESITQQSEYNDITEMGSYATTQILSNVSIRIKLKK